MFDNECPNCRENDFNGAECYICGYCNIGTIDNEYETPEGNIAQCSEEEAFDRGYISICPVCCYNIISWWEKEDHGVCIDCWHKNHMSRLTKI